MKALQNPQGEADHINQLIEENRCREEKMAAVIKAAKEAVDIYWPAQVTESTVIFDLDCAIRDYEGRK